MKHTPYHIALSGKQQGTRLATLAFKFDNLVARYLKARVGITLNYPLLHGKYARFH